MRVGPLARAGAFEADDLLTREMPMFMPVPPITSQPQRATKRNEGG
jgi:hypothetical protein